MKSTKHYRRYKKYHTPYRKRRPCTWRQNMGDAFGLLCVMGIGYVVLTIASAHYHLPTR